MTTPLENLHMYSCKLPVFLVMFYSNLKFLYIFSKNLQISNFTKIHTVEAELYHEETEKRTDMTQLIGVFCIFCESNYECRSQTLLTESATCELSTYGIVLHEVSCSSLGNIPRRILKN